MTTAAIPIQTHRTVMVEPFPRRAPSICGTRSRSISRGRKGGSSACCNRIASATPAAAATRATGRLTQLGVGNAGALLICGASGTVCRVAVQLAVVGGAHVISTASPANQECLGLLGAAGLAYGEGSIGM